MSRRTNLTCLAYARVKFFLRINTAVDAPVLIANADRPLTSISEYRCKATRRSTMYADQFENRLARVRHRFAVTLESKIEDTVISANQMSGGGNGMAKHISDSYRS